MRLTSLKPLNFGPFAVPTELRVEKDVTVLTGPNDAGKTSLLTLVRLICAHQAAGVEEGHYNSDGLSGSTSTWKSASDFGAIARFALDSDAVTIYPLQETGHELPIEIAVRFVLSPDQFSRRVIKVVAKSGSTNGGFGVPRMPLAITLPRAEDIREVIELDKPTKVEHEFLTIAFGAPPLEDLKALGYASYQKRITQAERVLNEKAAPLLPPALRLRFRIRGDYDKRSKLTVMLEDAHNAMTPLGLRGAGVRRVLSLLSPLLAIGSRDDFIYVLIDEPETSLHADMQHGVRRFLEQLATHKRIQVIYATHSPSMVNVTRPESLRLVTRRTDNGVATSAIDNNPIKENYLPIRASLGITPADSLLYAPLTIVVEGETEVVGLQMMLFKLNGLPSFEDAATLLSQSHFLDGLGDSFAYICSLAKSQGAKPVIFLDGDKARHLPKFKLSETHPDVPVVVLDAKKEIEEVLPRDLYFQALQECVGQDVLLPVAEFASWERDHSAYAQRAFTKRVDAWLDEKGVSGYRKPHVMRKAIELADVSQIEQTKLRELLEHMRRLLRTEPSGK